MTILKPIDYQTLPKPKVVEEFTFEQILIRKLRLFKSLSPNFSAFLESDPVVKLVEADSYDELLLRQRVNEAARARLLAFASGSDLDALAAFYGVTRMAGERDDPFKIRVRERTIGYSAAGGRAHYRFYALSASPLVRDVYVDAPGLGGVVRIAVLSTEGDGTPSPELMAAVEAVAGADDVRSMGHKIMAVPCDIVRHTVRADITLRTDANDAVFAGLASKVAAAFNEQKALGWNLSRSWLISQMHVGGVSSVDLVTPTENVIIQPNQCAAISLDLRMIGRDY